MSSNPLLPFQQALAQHLLSFKLDSFASKFQLLLPVHQDQSLKAVAIDQVNKHAVIVMDYRVAHKLRLSDSKIIATAQDVPLMLGGLLAENGQFWAVSNYKHLLATFDRSLRPCSILPYPYTPQDDEFLIMEGQRIRLQDPFRPALHKDTRKVVHKFSRFIYFFHPERQMLMKIDKSSRKPTLKMELKGFNFPAEFLTVYLDNSGRFLLLRGLYNRENNLVLFDTQSRKSMCTPSHVPEMYTDHGSYTTLRRTTTEALVYIPQTSKTSIFVIVAGIYTESSLPYVGLLRWKGTLRTSKIVDEDFLVVENEDTQSALEFLSDLTLEAYMTYHPNSLFQWKDCIYLILSNKILKFVMEDSSKLRLEGEQELIATIGYEDLHLDLTVGRIWAVDKFNRCFYFDLK